MNRVTDQENIVMRNWIVWTCALVILGGVPTFSSAQEKKTDGKTRSNPFGFSLKVSASTTDNRDSTATAEESNTDIKVSPRADGRIERPGTLLEFYYSPTYRYRSDPSLGEDDNELYHDIGANLDHEFSERFRIELRDFYNVTEDPAIVSGGGTLRQDGAYFLNRIQGLASYLLTKSVYVDLRVDHRLKEYDSAGAAANLDEEAASASLTVWRQVRDDTAVLAEVEVGAYEFDSTSAIRDFDRVQGVIGVHRVLGNGMHAGARVGITEIDHDDTTLGSESSPFVSATLSSDSRAKTRLRLGAGLELRDSDVAPFASQEHTHLTASLEHVVSKKIKLLGGVQYRVSEYDEVPSGLAGVVRGGDEDLVAVHGGVEYQLDNRQKIKAEASHQDLSSDVDVGTNRDYDRTTGTVTWQMKL
ncbi:MAG: outer membrane beta-barrel protein [Verrucomicrobia bacterium]|nr:outer membrane beta-barrel protein [Verrucomicrobiota bacterium]MDA1087368.1 outer membrane beta-barrel protein [Verrucomicrobiota bacterium]